MVAAESGDPGRDDMRRQPLRQAQPNMAGHREAAGIAFGRRQYCAFDRLGVKQQRLAGLAQPPLSAQRLEQRRTHRLTQAGEPPADGGDVDSQ